MIAHFGAVDLAGKIPLYLEEAGYHRRSSSMGRLIEGTRGYMAPELIVGTPPSRRSDVCLDLAGASAMGQSGGRWCDSRGLLDGPL
jgi:serine/threonine protein kinase